MNIRFFFPVLFVFAACAAQPVLVSYLAGSGVVQHFIPPTDWKAERAGAKARLDITYRTNSDTPAVINISFFGEKVIPRKISSAALNGGGMEYPLNNISVLYPNPDKKELRITSEGDRDTLERLFSAERISLTASIDGKEYTYIPDKSFKKLKESFITAISY